MLSSLLIVGTAVDQNGALVGSVCVLLYERLSRSLTSRFLLILVPAKYYSVVSV